MYYANVDICGVDTGKLKVLKESEKRELLIKAKAGSKAAREKLISCNLRLVLSVVQKFSSRGENMDDLFQVGCVGLIKAIDNFNPDLNVRFSTYGVPMIIGEIRRYLRDNCMLRVSRSMRDTAYKAMQAKEALIGKLGRDPTVSEIAVTMGCKKEDVVLSLEAVTTPGSLSEPVYNDGRDTVLLMDQLGDSRTDRDWLSEIAVKEAFHSLSDREKRIIKLRFFEGKTQTDVSKLIGISQAQVSRIEKGALAKIKNEI